MMTQQEALELIRKLLKAKDETELTELVSSNLGKIDGTFFSAAEAAAQQLERDAKPGIALALRSLTDRMLRMKMLI